MTVVLVTHERCADHVARPGHPERPDRLLAARRGIHEIGVDDALVVIEPAPAPRAAIERVHDARLIDSIELLCAAGGGTIDPDTAVNRQSFDAATLAAGAGLAAIDALATAEHRAAFCAVRPPGHHALPTKAMGFCLFNSIAISAATLADQGERVAVIDIDAHHGNGTQAAFYADPRVLYASLHQSPLYPYTGALEEVGAGPGLGTTVNIPLPAGATGDIYRAAFDDVVTPAVAAFAPTWLLVSAGFDAHRYDPLTGLALTSGDYADLTAELMALVPPGRSIYFLEGGYQLDALAASVGACVAALAGEIIHPEQPSRGGQGVEAVAAARRVHARVEHR